MLVDTAPGAKSHILHFISPAHDQHPSDLHYSASLNSWDWKKFSCVILWPFLAYLWYCFSRCRLLIIYSKKKNAFPWHNLPHCGYRGALQLHILYSAHVQGSWCFVIHILSWFSLGRAPECCQVGTINSADMLDAAVVSISEWLP